MRPTDENSARPPAIRLVDVVATTGIDGLQPAGRRLLEIPVDELLRLIGEIGADGVTALAAYLLVVHHESTPDGGVMLAVDDFSARWLMSVTPLGKNAAYRAQAALVSSGLFKALMSGDGVGARGRQRGALSPNLVLVRGEAGDTRSLERGRSHHQRGIAAVLPVSGTWESAPVFPVSGEREHGPDFQMPGERESGVVLPSSGNRQSGATTDNAVGVSHTSTNRQSGTTRSSSVEVELLGDGENEGLLWRVLAPELAAGRTNMLHTILNDAAIGSRALPLGRALGYDGPESGVTDMLVALISDLLSERREVLSTLRQVGVRGTPWGSCSSRQLVGKVIVGILAGLSMRRVASWASWLHNCTGDTWNAQPTSLTTALTTGLRARLPASPRATNDAPGLQSPAEKAAAPGFDVSVPVGQQGPSPTPTPIDDGGGAGLSDEEVNRLWPEATANFPYLPAERSRDARFRRTLVTDWLAQRGA